MSVAEELKYSKRLFDNLPEFAKLFDHALGDGLLEFFCETIQPEFDYLDRLLAEREFYTSPTSELNARNLIFLQQLIGFADIEGHYLGVGLNPEWDVDTQREVLLQGWDYLKHKGTEEAIRQAITMWLRWEPELETLQIIYPFGNEPQATPQSWWGWDTPYDYNFDKSYVDYKFFGGSYIPGVEYQQQTAVLESLQIWSYDQIWHPQKLNARKENTRQYSKNYLGPSEAWMHCRVPESQWNNVFNDIRVLNEETWVAGSEQKVFQWIDWQIEIDSDWLDVQEIEGENETAIEFKPLGFSWYHTYSFDAENTRRLISSTTWAGVITGWQWGAAWAGTSTKEIATNIVIASYQFYPGFQWNSVWYGETLTLIQSSATKTVEVITTKGMDWNSVFDPGRMWVSDNELFDLQLVSQATLVESEGLELTYDAIPWTAFYTQVYRNQTATVSHITPSPPWYSQFENTIQTEVLETEIDCTPGREIEIQQKIGTEEIVIPGVDSDLKIGVETIETEVITPAIQGIYPGMQWIHPWVAVRSESQNAFGLDIEFGLEIDATLDIDFSLEITGFSINEPLDSVTLLQTFNNLVYEIHLESQISKLDILQVAWFVNHEPGSTVTIQSQDYAFVKTDFMTWLSLWEPVKRWAIQGIPDSITEVDVLESIPVRLCNISEFWSVGLLDFLRVVVTDPSESVYPNRDIVLDGNNWMLGIDCDRGYYLAKPTTFRYSSNRLIAEFLFLPERLNQKATEDGLTFMQLSIGSQVFALQFNQRKNLHSEQVLAVSVSADLKKLT